jgi:hypothetical protein
MNTLKIVEVGRYKENVKFILDIQFEGEFTIVGCSIRSEDFEEVDFPLRCLYLQGECIWLIPLYSREIDLNRFKLGGEIRFSTWNNEKCAIRLSDTGWQPYKTFYTKVALGSEPIPEKELNKGWLVPYNNIL